MLIVSITLNWVLFGILRRYCDISDACKLRKFINRRFQKIPSPRFGISANYISIGRFSMFGCFRGLSITFVEEDIALGENDNHGNIYFGVRQFEDMEEHST